MKIYPILVLVMAMSLLSGGCLNGDSDKGVTTPPPVQAPVLALSNVTVTIGPTTANVTWTTNVPADSMVKYGTASGKYTASEGGRDYVIYHDVAIANLLPGTNYYIKVGSVTPGGVASQSREFNFTTIPQPPPVISGISVSTTSTTALIKWTTDIPSDGMVRYAIMSGVAPDTISGTYNTSREGRDYVTSHEVTLVNLLPGSTYSYRVTSTEPNGIFAESEELEFTAKPAKLREKIVSDDLEIRLNDFGDYFVERGEIINYYSRAEIEIKNAGEKKIPLVIASTAIVDNLGYQSDPVSIGAADEFKSTEIFPGGEVTKALYYEEMKGASGTLYMSINSKPYQFQVR